MSNIQPCCGYCEDCRWWETTRRNGTAHGICLRENEPGNKYSTAPFGEPPTIYLETAADFGCVQFEAKEDRD